MIRGNVAVVRHGATAPSTQSGAVLLELSPSRMPDSGWDQLPPDALSGRREDGVEHRWSGHENRRLADAAPEPARRHDNALDLGHVADAHRVVAVEVGLLDAAVLYRALLVEQRGEAVDERAGDLPFDLRRVDCVAGVGRRDDAVDFHRTLVDRDLGTGRDVAAVAHVLGEAAIDALRRRLAPTGTFGHRVEH